MQPTMRMEGFFGGPARGAGVPDCTRTSQESAKILGLFEGRQASASEGADDLRELSVLLGKLSCLKRDLMSPGQLVEATRKQPFSTAHDMEPVAETAARCFAKTMPKRDLDLAFDKWSKRGDLLLRRLCTAYDLTPTDATEVRGLFKTAMADFADVAYNVCQKGDATIAGEPAPRMLQGLEPAGLNAHMEYKGYY